MRRGLIVKETSDPTQAKKRRVCCVLHVASVAR